MAEVNNFGDSAAMKIIDEKGPFSVVEYHHDMSVSPERAVQEYYMGRMGIRRRQLMCNVDQQGVAISAGAMQWFVGDIEVSTGVTGAGDLVGKLVRRKMSGESAIKPVYKGDGILVLEPTYKHLLLWDTKDWPDGVVLDDGLFLACQSNIKQTIKARNTLSSAIAGGEGLFNLCLQTKGVFCVESDCPQAELVTIDLEGDTLKIDGNYAIAWSAGLKFTVERTTKTLIGSAASGEGLVNVYRGTGRVVMQPVR